MLILIDLLEAFETIDFGICLASLSLGLLQSFWSFEGGGSERLLLLPLATGLWCALEARVLSHALQELGEVISRFGRLRCLILHRISR